jgi:hypothetical protein
MTAWFSSAMGTPVLFVQVWWSRRSRHTNAGVMFLPRFMAISGPPQVPQARNPESR